jgi:hypothetical protein
VSFITDDDAAAGLSKSGRAAVLADNEIRLPVGNSCRRVHAGMKWLSWSAAVA